MLVHYNILIIRVRHNENNNFFFFILLLLNCEVEHDARSEHEPFVG